MALETYSESLAQSIGEVLYKRSVGVQQGQLPGRGEPVGSTPCSLLVEVSNGLAQFRQRRSAVYGYSWLGPAFCKQEIDVLLQPFLRWTGEVLTPIRWRLFFFIIKLTFLTRTSYHTLFSSQLIPFTADSLWSSSPFT